MTDEGESFWSADHEDNESPYHIDTEEHSTQLTNEICSFESETGTFGEACAHINHNTNHEDHHEDRNENHEDHNKNHESGADDYINIKMMLDVILDDNKSNSEFSSGTLSFRDVTEVHSQSSPPIKCCKAVPEGDNFYKQREKSESVSNKEVFMFPHLKFEVISARTVEIENEKKHVVYTLMIRKDGMHADLNPAVIERRYTEFLELYQCLRSENPSLMSNVIFPKKVLLGNFDVKLISERSTCFEKFLKHAAAYEKLRNSSCFNKFMQHRELTEARRWMEQKRYDQAVPLLENCFRLLNKVHTDRHPEVMLALCRLVACCNANPFGTCAEQFAELALRRYEAVSDTDLLKYYIPLLQLCIHLWWQLGKDRKLLEQRLDDLKHRGISVDGCPTLMNALIKDGII